MTGEPPCARRHLQEASTPAGGDSVTWCFGLDSCPGVKEAAGRGAGLLSDLLGSRCLAGAGSCPAAVRVRSSQARQGPWHLLTLQERVSRVSYPGWGGGSGLGRQDPLG